MRYDIDVNVDVVSITTPCRATILISIKGAKEKKKQVKFHSFKEKLPRATGRDLNIYEYMLSFF